MVPFAQGSEGHRRLQKLLIDELDRLIPLTYFLIYEKMNTRRDVYKQGIFKIIISNNSDLADFNSVLNCLTSA